MADDNLQKVKDKELLEKDLHTRMDADEDLVDLKKYVLLDADGNEIPHAVSITLTDLAIFAANVKSSLGGATEQVTVESEDKDIDTAYVEQVIKASFSSADALSALKADWQLNPFIDQQLCRRGRSAIRCLFRVEEGILIPDITTWDSRFVSYDLGSDGKGWRAYHGKKTKAEIEGEAWAKKIGFTINAKEADYVEWWGSEINEIYIGGKKEFDQPNPYGYPPVAIQIVPLGSMLATKGAVMGKGESIFFLIRGLIPEFNRLVSVIQSLNLKALDAALQWKSREGTETPPDFDKLTKPGDITQAQIGGGADQVPYGRLERSAWLLHSMIETRLQRGSLSNFDLGTFNQPMSAVALITIGEGRDQVFAPRLGTRGLLKQQLADMIIDQLIKTGETQIEIGTKGHKQTWDIGKLKGAYEVIFKYFVKSPKIDIARLTMANTAMAIGYDPETIYTDIMQVEDPKEMMRKRYYFMAEKINPNVLKYRIMINLLEMADDGNEDAERDAKIMADDLGVSLDQVKQGQLPAGGLPAEEKGAEPILPLIGKGSQIGGVTSSAKKASELEASPQEAEGEE